jgi:hypothetical protein
MNRREISQADVRYNYGYDIINDMVIITHPADITLWTYSKNMYSLCVV